MPNLFKRKFKQAAGKIRRFLLVYFQREYVSEQMENRQGECNQCGKCCELLFKCPFLIKNDTGDTLCSIYENRPKQCDAFPINKKCLSEVDFDCTYTFDAKPSVIQIETQLQQADD